MTWSAGGGVLIFFGTRAGIRGDVRYFRTFDDLEILGIPIAQSPGKVDFTRGSLGFVFRFWSSPPPQAVAVGYPAGAIGFGEGKLCLL